MNEENPVFMGDAFCKQPSDVQETAAEYGCRDNAVPDPHDPFGNETEFRDYNGDYGEIVPQIRIPGCQLPLRPDKQEKRKIRKYYSTVGGALLVHLLFSNILAIAMIILLTGIQTVLDTSAAGGILPADYEEMLQAYFDDSSSNMAMNLLVYGFCNVLTAAVGCRIIKVQIPSLFRTDSFKIRHILCYISIALFLQWACGWCSVWISDLLADADITLYEADFSTGQNVKNIVLSFIYSCIVAPVTEELLFRGFILKGLSRVSQHFGILMSAFLFGLWHMNFSQFILAFSVGMLMAYMDVKHNSILPSILTHFAVNLTAEIFSLLDTLELYTIYNMFDLFTFLVVIVGAVLLLCMFIRERLPHTTPAQAERGLRLSLTSFLMSAAIICYFAISVGLIVSEST